MSEYKVVLTPRTIRDMDKNYQYIYEEFKEPETTKQMLCNLEEGVKSLYAMPYRGTERKIGRYTDKGYRQLLVKRYTIVYRIDEQNKRVIVLTIRYTASEF